MSRPACWDWAVPAEVRAEVERLHLADVVAWHGRPETGYGDGTALLEVLHRWQAGRCALCGRCPDTLVLDHDHYTTLVRGWLCRSCNVAEGASGAVLCQAWRRCPATAILRMWIPWGGTLLVSRCGCAESSPAAAGRLSPEDLAVHRDKPWARAARRVRQEWLASQREHDEGHGDRVPDTSPGLILGRVP